MNAPTLSKVEQIRARDGDACWLCTLPFNFSAVPNSKKAPTVEHLVAKSLGGGSELTNLVLTHPHCNRQLADKPLAKKLEIRAKVHANAAKVAAREAVPVAEGQVAEPFVPTTEAKTVAQPKTRDPVNSTAELRAELAYWRKLALISGSCLLVCVGFVLGSGTVLLFS